MNWNKFALGFWHTFGPHGGESKEEILERKAAEIAKNGWTVWSFQFRRTLEQWFEILRDAQPEKVYVLLSDSWAARDPASEVNLRTKYRLAGNARWHEVPSSIRIPHPGRSEFASAFLIKNIIRNAALPGVPPLSAKWYSFKAGWRKDRLPTRGEYLIQREDNGASLRRVHSLLELKYPYLATLRT
ncbi:MAG: hypothetical protein L0191_00065 [Acidobacteria bacterium]|nr:hypothetical protein [Acidobacteriota bacterium]